ncbi:hypothetical protein CUMW_200660 [Citrus unshiu]|uniref:Uncharacterized protein n=1 Tax=Citrus unshiu TaxID=55188 RepID=A0A2H5Q6R5_CITUN|nr:hypothetical protein CUMW_200660 [Citrus unshiu]
MVSEFCSLLVHGEMTGSCSFTEYDEYIGFVQFNAMPAISIRDAIRSKSGCGADRAPIIFRYFS